MKKYFVPLIFCISTLIWAQIGSIDGAGLNLNFSSTIYNDTDGAGEIQSASESDLFLQPSAHFQMDEVTEFVPFLTFGTHWESNPDNLARATGVDDDVYRLSVGGGASLLWHFLNTWRIDLITGLCGEFLFGLDDRGDGASDTEFLDFDFQVCVPLAMDFILTRDLTLRMSADIVSMGYHYHKEDDGSTTDTTGVIQSSFPFLSDDNMALVSLAAIYWFGDR